MTAPASSLRALLDLPASASPTEVLDRLLHLRRAELYMAAVQTLTVTTTATEALDAIRHLQQIAAGKVELRA